jgi:hypothetical protein
MHGMHVRTCGCVDDGRAPLRADVREKPGGGVREAEAREHISEGLEAGAGQSKALLLREQVGERVAREAQRGDVRQAAERRRRRVTHAAATAQHCM